MIIRKLFKFEGAHIVRDCSTDYCKKSIHGHSYLVEVFLSSYSLDNGCMVMDFGLLKPYVKDLIESFDHAWSFWYREKDDYKEFVKKQSERWVEMPVSPSAEGYALVFFYVIDLILLNTEFNNGERGVTLESVRVHETATGYAEAFREDALKYANFKLTDIVFSPAIVKDWTCPEMIDYILKKMKFINKRPKLYYQ